MKLGLSVRSRLLLLVVSLLILLGGANLLLAHTVAEQRTRTDQLREQQQRVDSINAVVRDLSTYRFALGQLNSALLVDEPEQLRLAREGQVAARADLDRTLETLALFDTATVATIRSVLARLPVELQLLVEAHLAGEEATARQHLGSFRSGLELIEHQLQAATDRELAASLAAQQNEALLTRRDITTSSVIVLASSVAGIAIALWLLGTIVGPLRQIVHSIRQVNLGNTEASMPPVTPDEFGDVALALRQFRDRADQLRELAYTDSLTGLGSRARLEHDLEAALADHASGDGHRPLGLVYVNLDKLRNINDSLGHRAGDRFICEAAQRLKQFLPMDAVICRHGGDKFTVILDELDTGDPARASEVLSATAENIVRGMAEPYPFRGHLLPMTVSIGIACFPADGNSVELLVTAAEAAMFKAKRAGGNRAEFARPELTDGARERLAKIADIRRGLIAGEFEPYFQPLVDVTTMRVTGAEALLRWRHHSDGIVMPKQFIQVAEESGLIRSLGEHCLRRSWDYSRSWQASGRAMKVSVNLSARQIEDRTILGLLRDIRPANDSEPQLDFEITETAMLSQIEHAQATCREIRDLGFRLSVDDFGTGYSSLSYVQRFPIDKIKIDQSFVAKIGSSREAQAIISATIALAQRLDYEVVAEGVETLAQMETLRDMGCTVQQGYYFAKAMPANEFRDWVARYERSA